MSRFGGSRPVLGPCACKHCGLRLWWTGWAWYDREGRLHRCWVEKAAA